MAVFTTILVAWFAYVLLLAPTAHAADATWNKEAIVYDGQTYTGPKKATATDGTGLTPDSTYYVSLQTPAGSSTPNKAFMIYFAPGVSPPTETTARYSEYTYTNGVYSNPTNRKPISLVPQPASATANTVNAGGTTSCAVEGIGWIVCPISNFLAKGMDLVYSYISGFLVVRPLATTQNQPMYRVWAVMRDLANICFVIGFLIMVYGQISGGLLSNYTIKKLLPRVIVAAIMVNVSYWLCAIAVDLFNILGYSVQDIFISVRNSLVGSEGNSWQLVSWTSLTSLILSGGSILAGGSIAAYLGITSATTVAVGAGVGGLIILVLPLLLSGLFVVLMTFLILAARQAIITILIILAPLAFVAYLLPNTEGLFDKWRKAFVTLLLVFPAFSFVFGGSQLAASIVIQNADSLNMIILALGIQVAPLAITPLLLRLGGGTLNRFAGIVNNPTKGVFDRGKTWANGRTEQNKSKGYDVLATRAKRMGYPGKRPSSSRRGLRGSVETAGMRLNPLNAAYARQYDKVEREQMKSANDAAFAGKFTQTGAGRRVSNANLDAQGEKHAGDNANGRSYNNSLYKGMRGTGSTQDAYRYQLHHTAHIDKGIGDLYETAVTNHSERDLRQQINDSRNLRKISISSAVDAGLAESAKKSVEAKGALALKYTVMSTPGLKDQAILTIKLEKKAGMFDAIVQKEGEAASQREIDGSKKLKRVLYKTVEYENEAKTIGNKLQKKAESRWETITNDIASPEYNADLRSLRLEEIESTDALKRAETQWNEVIETIRRDGASAATITSQRDRVAAGSIRQSTQDTTASEKATEDIKAVVRSRAEKQYVESAKGSTLSAGAQAARDVLESVKATESAKLQEWRTEAGAEGLTGDEARIAEQLREADIIKKAQSQRTAQSVGLANQEYAGGVLNGATIPGGTQTIAEIAGGISGNAGISQAKATAKQTVIEGANKAIAAEKTLVSQVKETEILGETIIDPNDPNAPTTMGLGNKNILDESEERIAALGGSIASRKHMASHIMLWDRMSELEVEAEDALVKATRSGNQDAIDIAKSKVSKVKSLQMQVMGDKSGTTPFGVGDNDQGDAQVGRYKNNIWKTTRDRLNTHMSGEKLAGLNPDDTRLIFEMARAGKLTPRQLKNVSDAYKDWQTNPNISSSLENKHRVLLDPIKAQVELGTDTYPKPEDSDFWKYRYEKVISMGDPT